MRRLSLALSLTACALAASACGAAAPPPTTPVAAPAAQSASAAYVLGPGDKVRLIVFGEQNLSGEYTVAGSGVVALPLIGEVKAAGLTVPALTEAIRTRLADGYLRDPQVAMEVMGYRPYYLFGEVSRPSQYPYTNDLTVLNAVAAAGGFTYRADQKWVFIRHQGSTKEERVRLTGLTLVAPGDTLRFRARLF
jgi:protein involved in polysaccharide export with SLBB domain